MPRKNYGIGRLSFQDSNEHELISKNFDKLTMIQQQVINLRRIKKPPITLRDIGKLMGRSGERIRHIEVKALRIIRNPH